MRHFKVPKVLVVLAGLISAKDSRKSFQTSLVIFSVPDVVVPVRAAGAARIYATTWKSNSRKRRAGPRRLSSFSALPFATDATARVHGAAPTAFAPAPIAAVPARSGPNKAFSQSPPPVANAAARA